MTAETPDISILIVCYNSLDLIGPTLAGLFQHTRDCTFEVLLTDCSDDGTVGWVRQHYPSVQIIENDQNLGFARGNNFLADFASAPTLLLLNPDVIIHDNAVGELYRCRCEFPDAGAWGGQTRLPDGRVDPGAQQSTPTLTRLALAAAGQEKRTIDGLSPNADKPESVEGLSGAFLMIDRQRWIEMGGFDTSFFMYAEELDLCYRLRQTGRDLIMTPKAQITHLVGSGSSLNPKRTTAIVKAKMHFLRKHRGGAYACFAGILFWIAAFNRTLAGWLGSKLTHRERPAQLAAANSSIVCHPGRWWSGYADAGEAK